MSTIDIQSIVCGLEPTDGSHFNSVLLNRYPNASRSPSVDDESKVLRDPKFIEATRIYEGALEGWYIKFNTIKLATEGGSPEFTAYKDSMKKHKSITVQQRASGEGFAFLQGDASF